jgi:hypothetical protein
VLSCFEAIQPVPRKNSAHGGESGQNWIKTCSLCALLLF